MSSLDNGLLLVYAEIMRNQILIFEFWLIHISFPKPFEREV